VADATAAPEAPPVAETDTPKLAPVYASDVMLFADAATLKSLGL